MATSWKRTDPATKTQEKSATPLAVPRNGTAEEQPDFWLSTTFGGIWNADSKIIQNPKQIRLLNWDIITQLWPLLMPTPCQSFGYVIQGRTEKCTHTLPLQHLISEVYNQYSKNRYHVSAHNISIYKKRQVWSLGEKEGIKVINLRTVLPFYIFVPLESIKN